MNRVLIATMPAAGHVGPLLPLARELVRRDHEVSWYTGAEYRDLPERAGLKGRAKFKFDVRHVFIAAVPGQVADLEALLDEVRPDVIVAEPGMAAAAGVIEQRHGIPWATCGISAFAAPTPVGHAGNGALRALMHRTLYRQLDRDYQAMRATLAMEPTTQGVFDATLSPHLCIQPTVPSFEYPRRDLPPQVRFVGPLLPPAPSEFEPPRWWNEMQLDRRPVVLVTQGTIATDPRDLLLPALEALRDEPVQVIAVTGGPDPADLPAPPENARIERHIPFAALMPHVSAMVTNGGYGGLHFALSHGVPLVVAGASEERPELVARINRSGAGIGMRTQRPAPARLRTAVRRLLADPSYACRALKLQAEMARYDGPATAADLVEELAGVRTAVPS